MQWQDKSLTLVYCPRVFQGIVSSSSLSILMNSSFVIIVVSYDQCRRRGWTSKELNPKCVLTFPKATLAPAYTVVYHTVHGSFYLFFLVNALYFPVKYNLLNLAHTSHIPESYSCLSELFLLHTATTVYQLMLILVPLTLSNTVYCRSRGFFSRFLRRCFWHLHFIFCDLYVLLFFYAVICSFNFRAVVIATN